MHKNTSTKSDEIKWKTEFKSIGVSDIADISAIGGHHIVTVSRGKVLELSLEGMRNSGRVRGRFRRSFCLEILSTTLNCEFTAGIMIKTDKPVKRDNTRCHLSTSHNGKDILLGD